jgi:hypothetical protein
MFSSILPRSFILCLIGILFSWQNILAQDEFTIVFDAVQDGVVKISRKSDPQDAGSGFLINADGYILTNFHVIENALKNPSDLQVSFYNKKVFTCQSITYVDSVRDIALLKVKADTGRQVLSLLPAGEARRGQNVAIVGNPLGVEFTITKGIVSSPMPLPEKPELMQYDAATNQGNSGGPVLNAQGQVVGMVMGSLQNNAGIIQQMNYAVKVSYLRDALNKLSIQWNDTAMVKLKENPDSILAMLRKREEDLRRAEEEKRQKLLRNSVERAAFVQDSVQKAQIKKLEIARINDSLDKERKMFKRLRIIANGGITFAFGDLTDLGNTGTQYSFNPAIGWRFGVNPQTDIGSMAGFFGRFGTAGSSAGKMLANTIASVLPQDSIQAAGFTEIEAGVVLGEVFRLSTGIGSTSLKTSGLQQDIHYFTGTLGVQFSAAVVNFELLTSGMFGGDMNGAVGFRINLGAGIKLDFLRQ